MEVSPDILPLSQPQRRLKRSASTASLPTPPRTHRRHKRGRSRGDCDSESDKEEAFRTQGSTLSSSDEDGDILPTLDQRSRKKRRLSHSKGNDGEEEAFWLAGPDTKSHQADTANVSDKEHVDSSSLAPLVYRRSLKRSHSQSSSGLASPPPSRRKTQSHVLITPPAGTPGPSTSTTLPQTQPASPPKTPKKQTGAFLRVGRKTPEFPIISDSPNNPFYVVPGSPSPGEESESPRVDSVSPRTPGSSHHERPTVTYVFRGVRREYANPLYNHRKNRPLTPPPATLLPIEHPDYSPDVTCKPTVLFPHARKGKRLSSTRVDSKGEIGSSTSLRRSPRRKKTVIGDSDDENQHEVRATEEGGTIIKPRKLDFGLPKNATSKVKAKVPTGGDDVF